MLASNAVAAAFGPTKTLRTAASGVDLDVGDMAGIKSKIVVGWDESPPSGKASYIRWSSDGGATFASRRRLDTQARREVQVDVCSGWAWAVGGLHPTGDPASEWLVEIDGYRMAGTYYEHALVTLSDTARKPDIACAGNRRLAVAWFENDGAGYRVKLFSRHAVTHFSGDAPDVGPLDLGAGTVSRGLAVAATSSRIVVAWFASNVLKVKTWSIGAGPDYLLTAHATHSIGTLPYGGTVEAGISGSRVVLAYSNRADLVARISTNGGTSFGGQRILRDEPFPSEIGAYPTNVDVVGSRILVEGAEIGGVETLVGKGFGMLSVNGGSSWSGTSSHNGGVQTGAFFVRGGATRIAESWDQSVSAPSIQHLRFHRS